MNIQQYTDMHLDINHSCDGFSPDIFTIAPETDVLLITGDTFNNAISTVDFIYDKMAKKLLPHQTLIYLFGNHEFYDCPMEKAYEYAFSRVDENPQVVFLTHDRPYVMGDVVFIGDTLWTDYQYGLDPVLTKLHCKNYMSDHSCIIKDNRLFTPDDAHQLHKITMASLRAHLKTYSDKKIVMASHHSPSLLSINPKYYGHASNGAYVSSILEKCDEFHVIKYCFHGHVHDKVEKQIHGVWLCANPFGYMKWYGGHYENDNFEANRVFSI